MLPDYKNFIDLQTFNKVNKLQVIDELFVNFL